MASGWLEHLLLTALLALAACAAPRALPSEAPALVETASEANSLAPPSATAPDTSLTLAVYRAAGVPELDHAWSVAEYQRCLQVFVELLRGGRGDLPRAGSVRSGALFARLLDPANLTAPAGVDTAERARRLQTYLEVFPGFLKVYAPANDGVDFALEQTELIVGLLELLKSALDDSRELSATDPSWLETYQRQKDVTLGVVRGSGTMLAEPARYPESLRRYLKAHLAARAAELERHLDPEPAREVHAIALE